MFSLDVSAHCRNHGDDRDNPLKGERYILALALEVSVFGLLLPKKSSSPLGKHMAVESPHGQ